MTEHRLPNRRPESIQGYLLQRSMGVLLLNPEGPIRKDPSRYEAIPWPVYATLGSECLKDVTVGAMEVRETHGLNSDWRSGVFIRFYWQDPSGEVRETVSLEALASQARELPILSSRVDVKGHADEDFTLWRTDGRRVSCENEADYVLGMVRKLYETEYA
jgi:hypothetical protein